MKNAKEFKIGLFVVSILVISFFTINFLRGEDIFDREIDVTARYENLDGLVASAPVYIKGYKAGKVTKVEYDSQAGDFMVTCSVVRDFHIPVDSKMSIYAVDVMGTKGVRIDLGQSTELIEDGGLLDSYSEPALLDGLAASIAPLIGKFETALDSMTVTVAGVNRLLSDSNQDAVQHTLLHLEKTMADISSLSAMINGRSSELEDLIASLSGLSEKFLSIADKVDSTMVDINSITNTLDRSDIGGLVESLNKLLVNIEDPDGTIGKLLSDCSVYDSVDELLTDVDDLVKKIKENPKKYLKISVF